jgi:acetyltransferase-like isoleucine patch superfamily enzyme
MSSRPSRTKATILCPHSDIAPDCEFGADVRIEAEEIHIAPGCRIGWSGEDDFRTPGGVRIMARRLLLGPNVVLGRALRMQGGDIHLDEGVRIQRHGTIRVTESLHIGAYGTVGEYAEIMGRKIQIGQELWMLPQAKIGGGSAFENDSSLQAGHYLHLGIQSFINTARPVIIGDEVGLGTRTAIYTHGAYPSRLMGFPVAFDGVSIGDHTWIPGAVINPGVQIGKNCVVGVNSLVTRSLPDGCLAGGSPAKVLRENCFPAPLVGESLVSFFVEFFGHFGHLLGAQAQATRSDDGQLVSLACGSELYAADAGSSDVASAVSPSSNRTLVLGHDDGVRLPPGWTYFNFETKRIAGVADSHSDRLANELRRYGIRFYSRGKSGVYVDW